jgi:hypothetical protein
MGDTLGRPGNVRSRPDSRWVATNSPDPQAFSKYLSGSAAIGAANPDWANVMTVRNIYALLFVIGLMAANSRADEPFRPDKVAQCLKSPKAAGLTVLADNNPYYLRGDFDGDGKPDYALSVRSKKGGTGVLVCAGNGAFFLLGSGIGGGQFSNMPQDNFLAPHWPVYAKQEVTALAAHVRYQP